MARVAGFAHPLPAPGQPTTKNSRKLLTRQLGSVVRQKSDNQNQRITEGLNEGLKDIALAVTLLFPCCFLAVSLLVSC